MRRCAGGAGTPPLAGGRPRAAARGGVNTGGSSQHAAPLGPGTLRGVPRVCRGPAALRCVSRVYSRGSPRSTRCGTFIVFVCVPDRMHQLTQSSEPQGPQMHTRRAHTRPRPPPPTKDNLPHETHTHTHSARVVWSRVTESSSFANKQHAWAHGEHHATRPCSPSVLPRIPPPFDAPPKIDAGLLSSQFSTPVGCVACTGGELWGGDVSV